MKYISILSLFFLLFISNNNVKAQDNIIDEVIWVVGDEAILKSDVENTRLQLQFEGQKVEGDPDCVIPEQMAIQKLYLHQAKIDSIYADESRVSQYVDQRINNAIGQIGSKEKLEEYLGKPLSQVRDEWSQSTREQLVVEQMQQKIVGDIKTSPAEIRQFYNSLPKDSLPFIPETVEVEVITQEPKIPLKDIDAIKARLRDFTDRVNKGEVQFSTLATLYSEDTESAPKGGELDFKGKGQLVPEFAAVAFDLNDPKKVSRIVETEYGYHIIQLIEKRGDRINVRHILLKPKVTQAELDSATIKMDSIRSNILKKKYTFGEAATYLSYDKNTRNNNGLMVNSGKNADAYNDRIGTSRFEMGELPQEVAITVDKMKVGEMSKPFTMINDAQREVVAMVKLRSRTPGHKADLADDYQTIRSMLEAKKKSDILNKWITQKQKDTYVWIDNNWKNCKFKRGAWIKD